MPAAELDRYDERQLRGFHGRWSKQPFDMEGFDLISQVEGSFGDVEMGVDDVGDVRLAFRDHGENRELDLGGDEVRQLHSALEELSAMRDDFGTDGSADELIDEHWFGYGQEHKASLYSNGLIEVVFGAEEADPKTLQLDPPADGRDDVQALVDGLDDVLNELPDEDAERASVSTVAELQRKYNPGQLRDPGGEHGGQWIKNPGAEAKEAASHLVADELDIADRIDLQPDEHLVLSDAFSQRNADYELNAAIIQKPGGRQVRLGVTHEDDSWPGDSTDTLHLEPEQFRKVHADLANAAKDGKTAAAQAQKAWDSGSAPSDPRLLGSSPVVKGTVSAGDANLNWSVYVTDAEPASWELSLDVEDGGDLTLSPRDTTKLLKFLQTLESHLGTPDASRAYSQEQGTYQPAAAAGPPKGGQFAKGGGRVGAKGKSRNRRRPARPQSSAPKPPSGPPKPFSYDGNTGTGYGIKGGDPGVRTLQADVNRLGILDSSGNELAVDGRYGPRTTSAVKKLQKALGLQVTGQVTPEFLKQVSDLQQLPPKPPRQRRAAKPKTARQSKSRRVAPARRSQILAQVSRALGEHRMVDGACVTCGGDDLSSPKTPA